MGQGKNYDEKFWLIFPLQIVNMIFHNRGEAVQAAICEWVETGVKMITMPNTQHRGCQQEQVMRNVHARHVVAKVHCDARIIRAMYTFTRFLPDLDTFWAEFEVHIQHWEEHCPPVGKLLRALHKTWWLGRRKSIDWAPEIVEQAHARNERFKTLTCVLYPRPTSTQHIDWRAPGTHTNAGTQSSAQRRSRRPGSRRTHLRRSIVQRRRNARSGNATYGRCVRRACRRKTGMQSPSSGRPGRAGHCWHEPGRQGSKWQRRTGELGWAGWWCRRRSGRDARATRIRARSLTTGK